MNESVLGIAELRQRVSSLEQKRRLPYDGEGRVRLPGGIIIGDGAGGSTPIGPVRPVAPGAPTVTPGAFLDRVFADVSWAAVSGAASYEVVARHVPSGSVTVQTLTSTSVRFSDLRPNEQYGFRIYTVDGIGRASDPSPETVVDVGQDTTVPPAVTGTVATVGLRSMVVRWDESAAPDVAGGRGWYEVQIATNATFTQGLRTVRVSALLAAFGDLAPTTTYRVRVAAIDASGNIGPWSNVATATTLVAGAADLGTGSVGTAQLAVGAITADKAIIANAAIVDAQIANVRADKLVANSGDLSWLRADEALVRRLYIGNGGTLQVQGPGNARLLVDASGIRLFNGANVRTVFLDAATGNAEFRGTVAASIINSSTIQSSPTWVFNGGSRGYRIDGSRFEIDAAQIREILIVSDGGYTGGGSQFGTLRFLAGQVQLGGPGPGFNVGENADRAGILLSGGSSSSRQPTMVSVGGDYVALESKDGVAVTVGRPSPRQVATFAADGVEAATAFHIGGNDFGGANINERAILRRGHLFIVSNGSQAANLRRVGSTGPVVDFRWGATNTQVGVISITASSTSYGTTSDHRLKRDVADLLHAPDRLRRIRPVWHRWTHADGWAYGFIAHELQTVEPFAVTGTKDAVDDDGDPIYQGVDASKLVPDLVAGWQHHDDRLALLERQLAQLTAA